MGAAGENCSDRRALEGATFPAQKMLATFEYGGVLYINSTAVHVNAACDFAVDCREADSQSAAG